MVSTFSCPRRSAISNGVTPIFTSILAWEWRKKSKRLDFLRHSHASMLIDMKFSIKEISDRLGHESPETTWKVYAHLYPGKDRKLADALNEVRATNDNAEDKNA